MKRSIAALAIAAVAPLVFTATPVQANEIGNEGCTPGYWKNHTDNWQEVIPTRLYGERFTSARANVAGLTFLQALDGGGGPGADGAALILARASTAAWLNAAHEGLGYPWRRTDTGLDGRPALVPTVNAAYASGSRTQMLELAARLDADNNLGCPLN